MSKRNNANESIFIRLPRSIEDGGHSTSISYMFVLSVSCPFSAIFL